MIIQQYEVWYTLHPPSPKAYPIKDESYATAVLRLELDDKYQVARATFDGRHLGAWKVIEHELFVQLFVAEPTGELFRELFIDADNWQAEEFPEWLYLAGGNEYLWREDDGASATIYSVSTGWGARVELNGFGFIKSFPKGVAGWLEAQTWCLEHMAVKVEDQDEEL